MTNFLNNLRNKPEPVKKIIMWMGIFFVMMIIFSFWIWNFPSSAPQSLVDESTQDLKKQLPGTWQNFKDQLNTLRNLWQK